MMRYRVCSILVLAFLTVACKPMAFTAPVSTSAAGATESGLAAQTKQPGISDVGMSPERVDEIVKEVMNQQYGDHFDASLGCWTYIAELVSGAHDYCMKPGVPRMVDVNDEKQLYFFAASRPDISDNPSYSYGQTDSGLMGAFAVKIESQAQWKLLAASKGLDFGSAGNCGCQEAKFVQLGAAYYGWLFTSGGIWQGIASLSHDLVAIHDGQFKDISAIPQVTEDEQDVEYKIDIDNAQSSDQMFPILVTKTKSGAKAEVMKINFDYQKWQYSLPGKP